jgi:hypothetical protein
MASVKKKVFVSFDFDNDKVLKEFIIGQSKHEDSPFEVADHSMKEAAQEWNWEAEARARIKRADITVVMVGPSTHKASGVLKEVAMTREEKKPIVQIIGYRDANPTPVPNAGRLYRWNWSNLETILAT